MVVESTSALGRMGMERVRTLPSSEEDAKPLLAKERMERGLAASDEQRAVAWPRPIVEASPKGTTRRLRRFAGVRSCRADAPVTVASVERARQR